MLIVNGEIQPETKTAKHRAVLALIMAKGLESRRRPILLRPLATNTARLISTMRSKNDIFGNIFTSGVVVFVLRSF